MFYLSFFLIYLNKDPEVFLIEDKKILFDFIENIKSKYEQEFNIFEEGFLKEKTLNQIEDKEVK